MLRACVGAQYEVADASSNGDSDDLAAENVKDGINLTR